MPSVAVAVIEPPVVVMVTSPEVPDLTTWMP